jgi:hypothetical protein
MKTKVWVTGLIGLVVLAGWSGSTLGATAFTATGIAAQAPNPMVLPPNGGWNTVFGWTFMVKGSSPIRITHVGVYDDGGDGLATDHEVGIWHLKELIGSMTVAAGSGTYDAGYRYVEVKPPIELAVDQVVGYSIAVLFPTDNTDGYVVSASPDWDSSGMFEPWWSPTPGYEGTYSRQIVSSVLARPETVTHDQKGLNVNFKYAIPVQIDVKPESTDNTVNLGSNGVVPVAILSTSTFDATQVDPATVTLAGSGVAVRGKGSNYLARKSDVNGDGYVDLVLNVETENLELDLSGSGDAILMGSTCDGNLDITGSDHITVVPPQ